MKNDCHRDRNSSRIAKSERVASNIILRPLPKFAEVIRLRTGKRPVSVSPRVAMKRGRGGELVDLDAVRNAKNFDRDLREVYEDEIRRGTHRRVLRV